MKKLLLLTTCLSLFITFAQSQSNDPSTWIPVNTEFVMAKTTVVTFHGGPMIIQSGSILAAFYGEECRGVVPIFVSPYFELFQLSIGCDTISESGITFKLYDALSDSVYDIVETQAYVPTSGNLMSPDTLTITPIISNLSDYSGYNVSCFQANDAFIDISTNYG
ncbi:MAG: hypothetical protein HOM80_12535, partial [Bacteroidetes bacterium]|nr:hypothetical protein [Bacteroidota bacterium]